MPALSSWAHPEPTTAASHQTTRLLRYSKTTRTTRRLLGPKAATTSAVMKYRPTSVWTSAATSSKSGFAASGVITESLASPTTAHNEQHRLTTASSCSIKTRPSGNGTIITIMWALWLGIACLTQCQNGAEAVAISTHANNSPEATTLPRFLSRGNTYRAVIGDTLVLPCKVENLGALVLLWRRGPSVLTAFQLMVTQDTRLRLTDGYNLEIRNLEPQDAGDYVCQISDKVNKDQIHTVEILVPPSIRAVPQTGQVTALKGGTITLECRASGNPVPTIFWTRTPQAGRLAMQPDKLVDKLIRIIAPKDVIRPTASPRMAPRGHQQLDARIGDGPILMLERVERQQSGLYQCTADNGVGEPVSVEMRLDILYPPDISVERTWVHSGEGFEAQLVCIVHANPAPTVSWFQNSFSLVQTDRRLMISDGNRHTLNIRHLQADDFGNYSCVADNSLGRSKKFIELTGRPAPAQFHSAPWSRSQSSFNLTWIVDSYPPLQEVRLLHRKVMVNETYQQPGAWHDVILLPTPRASGEPLSHLMSFRLKSLTPASVYEAMVQTKNRFGWSEVSEIFQFHTQQSSLDPRIVEYEKVASSISRNKASFSRNCDCITLFTMVVWTRWWTTIDY